RRTFLALDWLDKARAVVRSTARVLRVEGLLVSYEATESIVRSGDVLLTRRVHKHDIPAIRRSRRRHQNLWPHGSRRVGRTVSTRRWSRCRNDQPLSFSA